MAAEAAWYEKAGAGLLAAEPPTLDTPPPSNDNWPTLYAHLSSRLEGMRSWRYSWWQHWGHLARLLLPYRYHWTITPNSMNRGSPVNDSIVNSTGTLAMRICASGMLTGLMSPSRPWFRLGPTMESYQADAEGQRWLDDTASRIYAVLAGSNFYKAGAHMYQDVATFGTSPMIIYDDEKDVIRCYIPCAGEYFLASSARATNDTLFREYTYTVAQIVEWFGLENCPIEVRDKWRAGGASLESEYVVCHAIEPNFTLADRSQAARPVTVLPGHFVYREVYWLRGQESAAPLSLKGFVDRPFIVLGWSWTSNDPYARGPGMDAFGDVAQLQQEEVRKGEFIDKGVRPPMTAPPSMLNEPSSIRSGDITFINSSDGKQKFEAAIEVDARWLPAITTDIERVEKRIDRCFFVDVFLLISQMEGVQPRNELELAMRQGEKIQLLGPVIESAEGELSDAIYRIAGIMKRRGLLLPQPQSLQGVPIGIKYVSTMKLAQQAAETAGMEQTVKFAGAMAEAAEAAGIPSPVRVLNLDEYVRRYADAVGNPSKLVFSAKEVEAHDAIRAEHQQQQQALAATLPAVQAAKGLSDIDVGGGQNAIQAMLGSQPQQGHA